MLKFNVERVRTIEGEINFALSKLEATGRVVEEDFLGSSEKTDSAKYNLIVAIEGAIDICNHIAARAGGRAPCDYADCFVVLEELGIIPGELATRLERTARFRNLLVRLYWKVDNRKVHSFIRQDLGDIRRYLKSINDLIDKSQ